MTEPSAAGEPIAVLGLGEAGSCLYRDLAAAGVTVRGWDPAPGSHAAGLPLARSAQDAVAGAVLVLSVNAAGVAMEVVASVLPALSPGSAFADLNTGPPSLKRELDRAVRQGGGTFADVALLGPVPRAGIRTPCLVSGSGGRRFAELLSPFGMTVEVLDGPAGLAAARKLLRSVFMKGLAAAVIEAMAAAEAYGCRDWLHAEVSRELVAADAALVDRLLEGSRAHARRRIEEMETAADMLRELGVEPRVAEAAAGWLRTFVQR